MAQSTRWTRTGGSGPTPVGHRLAAAIDAPCHDLRTAVAGRIAYYAADHADGRPLVLLHSVNAAPSAIEMRPLFDHFRGRRPVYAPDLPGFGRSERSDRTYSATLYAEALCELLDRIVGQPADLIACSLSAEFAARAIPAAADRVRSLALISPTGLGRRTPPGDRVGDRLLRTFRLPLLGGGLFAALSSRASIRFFLGQAFDGPAPAALIDYAYLTAHQPGARFAPLYFLSGKLFSADAIDRLYRPLTLPVLVLYDRDPNVSFENLPALLAERPNWRAERIAPTRGLPHWERPEATVAALERFWQDLD